MTALPGAQPRSLIQPFRLGARPPLLALLFLAAALSTKAQAPARESRPTPDTPGIQDNSFLIEEAYNQDPGVVQHISLFQHDARSRAFVYTFTQEWPIGGLSHQLSYTLPLVHTDVPVTTGVGDVRLNYRYQLAGSSEAKLAVAPRLTVVLPTGDYRYGRGAGGAGLEVWLPASVIMSPRFAMHLNAGLTATPGARNEVGDRASTRDWTTGASAVWLTRPSFNVLLEGLWQTTETVVGKRKTIQSSAATLSPGIRWAYNYSSGLQIVPGIALPFGLGTHAGERTILAYLSFEHPLTRAVRAMAQR